MCSPSKSVFHGTCPKKSEFLEQIAHFHYFPGQICILQDGRQPVERNVSLFVLEILVMVVSVTILFTGAEFQQTC